MAVQDRPTKSSLTAQTASRAASTPAAPTGVVDSVLKHPFLAALSTPEGRRGAASPFYLLALGAVATLMVLLPCVYLLLIGLVGHATFWHATNDVAIFDVLSPGNGVRAGGRGSFYLMLILLVVYLAPIVAGVVAVVFMIKPLFAPRRSMYAPQAVTRRDQPLLFAFVDKLCDTVGAARPAQIHIDLQLNASASFAEGIGGALGGKMVLTVGLPLVAGTTLRQFTGILAHEFGHFAQRGGMRLTYVIHRINGWFARVVYERDRWDDALEGHAQNASHWTIAIIANLAKFVVWLSRRVLWSLMFVGHLFCSILLRQGEYDADRYSARVVGSKTTEEMLARLPLLSLATSATFDRLDAAWSERRLPEDLPAVIALRASQVPDDLQRKIRQADDESRTGWFDTHPAHRDRALAVRKRNEPGLFAIGDDVPASALFANFGTVCKLMTRTAYQSNVGDKLSEATLVTVEAVEEQGKQSRQRFEAMESYHAGLVHAVRPAFPSDADLPADADSLAERLIALRGDFAARVPDARVAAKDWDELTEKLNKLDRIIVCSELGLRSPEDHRALGLSSTDSSVLRQRRLQLTSARESARARVDAALKPGLLRMRAALALAEGPTPVPQERSDDVAPEDDFGAYDLADAPTNEGSELLDALAALRLSAESVEQLRLAYVKQETLVRHVAELLSNNRPVGEHLAGAVMSGGRKMLSTMMTLRNALKGPTFPFAAKGASITLAGHVVESMPEAEDVARVLNAAGTALERYYDSYAKTMAHLSERAASAEAEIGLSPLELA